MTHEQSNQFLIPLIEAHIRKYTHNKKNGEYCSREVFDICIKCELRECLEGLLNKGKK